MNESISYTWRHTVDNDPPSLDPVQFVWTKNETTKTLCDADEECATCRLGWSKINQVAVTVCDLKIYLY